MQVSSVYITTKTKAEAQLIGRALVEARLVACANVFENGHSIFWWGDEMMEVGECIIICKTRTELIDEVVEKVKSLHSYNTPCVTSWVIDGGNPSFLQWVVTETRPALQRVEETDVD